MGKIKVKDLLIVIVFVMLLFCMITINGSVGKLFQYSDEIITIVGYLYILFNFKTAAFQRNKTIIFVWSFFLLCGLISTLLNLSVISIVSILVDALLTCNKFFVAFLASSIYFSKNSFDKSLLFNVARIIIFILFIILVHDYIFNPWFELGDVRYGISSQSMFFKHQTYLSHAAILLILVQTLSFGKFNKKYLIDIILASIIVLATLRTKGVGFVLIYWFLLVIYNLHGIKHKGIVITIACIAVVVLSWNSFVDYFIAERFSPRKIMLQDSFDLLISYFPFGTGFGSYGSAMAAENYSPFYTQLGYESYSGMGPVDYHYLSDSFWPCIFAQFGILGTIAFLAFVVLLIEKCLNNFKKNHCYGFVMIMIVVFMLINSLAETSFFNPTSVLAFTVFGYCDSVILKKKIKCPNYSQGIKIYESKYNCSGI